MVEKKFNSDQTCCANCVFFDKFQIQKREDNLLGACHANPPFPAPEDQWEVNEEKKKSKLGIWPLVLGSFWCGVFTAKNGKE